MRRRTVLSIAGSDSSGGAGIQADLKTMTSLGVYGMTCITSLTAQNTLGVREAVAVTPDFLEAQCQAVFEDMPVDAIKIGMIPNAELIERLATILEAHPNIPVVLDPVMVASSGASLMENEAVASLKEKLLPRALVVTPNIPEGEVLSGLSLRTQGEMERAAHKISQDFPKIVVLLKGGHLADQPWDLLFCQGQATWFPGERIQTKNSHGTGCTLSSALACYLAQDVPLGQAVGMSKAYVSGALASAHNYGTQGSGPLDHMWAQQFERSLS